MADRTKETRGQGGSTGAAHAQPLPIVPARRVRLRAVNDNRMPTRVLVLRIAVYLMILATLAGLVVGVF